MVDDTRPAREDFWTELVSRFDRRIRAYARTTRGDADEVDEVVWNVWADATTVEDQLVAATDPWELLLPIVRRVCAVSVRLSRHEQAIEHVLDSAVVPANDERDPSLRLRLDALLRTLPTQQRMAVDFRFRWGWPYWAIAAALDTAESTVRVHTARGLQRLRQLLQVNKP